MTPKARVVQRAVVLGLLRPAHEQPAVAVKPRVRALDDPAPRPPVRVAPLRLDLLAARAHVRGEAELGHELAHAGVVVALVEAEPLRGRLARLRPLDRDRGERVA